MRKCSSGWWPKQCNESREWMEKFTTIIMMLQEDHFRQLEGWLQHKTRLSSEILLFSVFVPFRRLCVKKKLSERIMKSIGGLITNKFWVQAGCYYIFTNSQLQYCSLENKEQKFILPWLEVVFWYHKPWFRVVSRAEFGPKVDKKFGLNSGLRRTFWLRCIKIYSK